MDRNDAIIVNNVNGYDSSWTSKYNLSSKLSSEVVTKVQDSDMVGIIREYDDGSKQLMIDRKDGTVSVTNIITGQDTKYLGAGALSQEQIQQMTGGASDATSGNTGQKSSTELSSAVSYLYDKNTGKLLDRQIESVDSKAVKAMSATTSLGGGSGTGVASIGNQKWASGIGVTNGFGAAMSDNYMDSLKYNSAKLGQCYLELLNLGTSAKPVVTSLNNLSLGSHLSDPNASDSLSSAMVCINSMNDNMSQLTGWFKNAVDADYEAEHGNLEAFDEEGRETTVDIEDEYGNHYSSYTDYLENYNSRYNSADPGEFAYDIEKSDYVPYYAKTTTMGKSGGDFARNTTVVTDDYGDLQISVDANTGEVLTANELGRAISDCLIDGVDVGFSVDVNGNYSYYSTGSTFEKYDSDGNLIHTDSLTSKYGVFNGDGHLEIGARGIEAKGSVSFALIEYLFKYADTTEHVAADLDLRIAEVEAHSGIEIPIGAGKIITQIKNRDVDWDTIGNITESIMPEFEGGVGFNLLHLIGTGSFDIFGVSVGIDGDTKVGWSAGTDGVGGLGKTFVNSLKELKLTYDVNWEEIMGKVAPDSKADEEMQAFIDNYGTGTSGSSSGNSTGDPERHYGDNSGDSYDPSDRWANIH